MGGRPGTRLCTECGVTQTVRADGVCQKCVNATSEIRRKASCLVCDRPTLSEDRQHPKCRVSNRQPTAADALPPGDWRFDPFRRVRIYVADHNAARELATQAPKRGPKAVEVTNEDARIVACPKCDSAPDDWCHLPTGRIIYSETHLARRKAYLAEYGPAEEPAPELEVRECEWEACGEQFEPRNPRQRYCSESCKGSAYYRRRKDRDQAEVAA